MAKYKNIPVDDETYVAVKTLAIANGLGERGLGAQVKAWAERELPECDHPKVPVTIEYYPSAELAGGELRIRKGFFCATCNRVYQRVIKPSAVQVVEPDPYGQPAPAPVKKRGAA